MPEPRTSIGLFSIGFATLWWKQRAAQKDAPRAKIGVVVLSFGADRAPVIFECIKKGLVSHLFIDETLEGALLAECKKRSL